MSTQPSGSKVRKVMAMQPQRRVEFPSLEGLLSELHEENVKDVRVDVFHELSASELSFVHYVSLTLFVTALHPSGWILYEYQEPLTHYATAGLAEDEAALQSATTKAETVKRDLMERGFHVRAGRFAWPEVKADSE